MKGPFTRPLLASLALGLGLIGGCPSSTEPASYDPEEIALVRVEPADGEAAVARNRLVRITFNVTPLPSSIDDQSIKIRTGGTFQTRPEGSFLVNGNIVEFDPTVTPQGDSNSLGFPAGAQIVVDVPLQIPGSQEPKAAFVQNIEGNPITVASGDNKIAFTTGSGWEDPVAGPPGVIGVEFVPSPNALGQVGSRAAVVVKFTEAIDPSSIVLGKNIFLTNNTSTSPTYRQDIPSITFYDGSLTRYTFQPVFGFGQGPFNIQVNFIDPDNPSSFTPNNLPTDLSGNRVQNFTFVTTFDTVFDPSAVNTGLIREDFTTFVNRDAANTDARWGDDAAFPFNLVSQPVTNRIVNYNIQAILNVLGGSTVLGVFPPGAPNPESRYCPTIGSLPGTGVPIPVGSPPSSAGRRQLNLYRAAVFGGTGTIVRAAWGPDSDAIFAATYPQCIVRLGHKQKGTSLSNGSFFDQFDVDGFVLVADATNYKVGQASDVNGPPINNGYYNWPTFETFFDYNGVDELLFDNESSEGNTWQQFRTFMAFDNPFGPCTCLNFAGCNPNNSIGQTQMDSTFGGDQADPAPIPGTVFNPIAFLNIQQFELAKLRSQGQSRFRNSNSPNPDYLNPIISPLVQSGGAIVELSYSGSTDGIVEDVPFTPNINAIDGHRFIRWRANLRSNIFTKARARIALLELPFTFP